VHPRLDHRGAATLCVQAGFDRRQDFVVCQRERSHIRAIEIVEEELAGLGGVTGHQDILAVRRDLLSVPQR
jgi:hypothetical protein